MADNSSKTAAAVLIPPLIAIDLLFRLVLMKQNRKTVCSRVRRRTLVWYSPIAKDVQDPSLPDFVLTPSDSCPRWRDKVNLEYLLYEVIGRE
jgi:hypothetical protein